MFTGLIETVCAVKAISRTQDNSLRIAVDLGTLAQGTMIGDSIAINGVCLTVVSLNGSVGQFDASSETVEKSNIAKLAAGSKVNAERAMKASDRFGGHFVQGHVDGTATISSITAKGRFWDVRFAAGPEIMDQLVTKGSVAIDGISLTVASMDKNSFSVAIIPQTWQETTLREKKAGDAVNIETDIIVKVIKKQLEAIIPGKEGLSVEKLRQMGF